MPKSPAWLPRTTRSATSPGAFSSTAGRSPLPRHQPRRPPQQLPRPAPRAGGRLQAVRTAAVRRRCHERPDSVPGDPRARIPRRLLDRVRQAEQSGPIPVAKCASFLRQDLRGRRSRSPSRLPGPGAPPAAKAHPSRTTLCRGRGLGGTGAHVRASLAPRTGSWRRPPQAARRPPCTWRPLARPDPHEQSPRRRPRSRRGQRCGWRWIRLRRWWR